MSNKAPERIWIDKSGIKNAEARKAGSYYFEAASKQESIEYTRKDSDPIAAALAELRSMFPGLQIIVSVRDCGDETATLRGTALEYSIQVGINGEEFDADTLAEVMAAVRAWKEQQQK